MFNLAVHARGSRSCLSPSYEVRGTSWWLYNALPIMHLGSGALVAAPGASAWCVACLVSPGSGKPDKHCPFFSQRLVCLVFFLGSQRSLARRASFPSHPDGALVRWRVPLATCPLPDSPCRFPFRFVRFLPGPDGFRTQRLANLRGPRSLLGKGLRLFAAAEGVARVRHLRLPS